MATLNKSRLVSLAAAALIALLLTPAVRAADPAPAMGSPVIAIANIGKIVESIHEYQDLAGQLDLDQKSLKASATDKANNLNAMQQALSYLKSDSPQYSQQADKFLHAKIDYDVWAKETQIELERKQKTKMKSLFLEIQDAIAQIAQQEGINLVLADQRPDIPENLDPVTPDQLRQLISGRTVLFSDQSRDISGKVITLMDKNYAAKSAPK